MKYLQAGRSGGRGKIYPFLRKLGKIYKYSAKKRSSHLNSNKLQGKFIIYSAKKGHHIFQRISVRVKFGNPEVVKG